MVFLFDSLTFAVVIYKCLCPISLRSSENPVDENGTMLLQVTVNIMRTVEVIWSKERFTL